MLASVLCCASMMLYKSVLCLYSHVLLHFLTDKLIGQCMSPIILFRHISYISIHCNNMFIIHVYLCKYSVHFGVRTCRFKRVLLTSAPVFSDNGLNFIGED